MLKSKPNEQLRSPSTTPQSATSKQIIPKRKPPAHSKSKPQDSKTSAHQKGKKSRTNSITQKSSIYERIFHNSNLSETDVTSKLVEVPRPTSKISKSLINRLELTQKVKEVKKPSPFIDQIIRKSLNRAKKLKQSQEKENRKVEIRKEIKKHEMNYQNQQIRLENSLKYKKRKKSFKKNEEKVRSESSSKVRNYASLFVEPTGRNKRSVSIGEYYSKCERRSDTGILDYIQKKNSKGEEENSEFLQQRAAEIKAERLNNLEIFTKHQRANSPKARKTVSKSLSESEDLEKLEMIVERNISFIEDSSSIESLSQDEEKPTSSDYEIGKDRSRNIETFSQDSLEDSRVGAALLIQRAYRKYLLSRLLKKKTCLNIHCSSQVQVLPVRKTLTLHRTGPKISVKPEKPKKTLSVVQSNPVQIARPIKTLKFASQVSFKIDPGKKSPLQISAQSSTQLFPRRKPCKNLISRQYSFTIFPDKQSKSDSGQLHDQIKEQIAWNSAQFYIIEQLRSEEISTLFSVIENAEKREKIIEKVHAKYQSLLSVLKEASEFSQSDYLENLSVEEYSKFEKNKQSKQEVLSKALVEDKESCSNPAFSLNLAVVESTDQGVQLSSDLSSDEGEKRIGISHSRSLSQLHGDSSVGKYIGPSLGKESSVSKFPIFFEIDEPIEVQSVSFLSSDFPLGPGKNISGQPLPMLHLDCMQREVELSEGRILTSTDSVLDYIRTVLGKLDFLKVISELKKPIERNTEEELFKLQEKIVGTPSETRIYDFPKVLNYSDLLSERESSKELETTLRQINQSDKIHKKMLLDVLNVQMQQFRPNGFEGKPLIWSDRLVGVSKPLKAGEITEKVLRDLEVFSLFQIGRIFNEEIVSSNGGIDDGLIQSLREDRLERLIYFEIIEEEKYWTDYEFEETQVKFDVSDMVLECLIDELQERLG